MTFHAASSISREGTAPVLRSMMRGMMMMDMMSMMQRQPRD